MKSFPAWCHALESICLITTDKAVTTVRDEALQHVDNNDLIVIVRAGAPGAWSGGIDERITNVFAFDWRVMTARAGA